MVLVMSQSKEAFDPLQQLLGKRCVVFGGEESGNEAAPSGLPHNSP
jgi:hypothetical protein